MPSTRIQQTQILASVPFQQQVAGSLLALAVAVVTTEGVGFANHANRLIYANAILANPLGIAVSLLPGLFSQAALVAMIGGTVGASGTPIDDATCDAAVITVFNYYANQYAAVSQSPFGALQIGR